MQLCVSDHTPPQHACPCLAARWEDAQPFDISIARRFLINTIAHSLAAGLGVTWQAGQDSYEVNTTALVPVPAAEGRTLIDVCAGNGYTCGLDEAGRIFCWGAVRLGALDQLALPSQYCAGPAACRLSEHVHSQSPCCLLRLYLPQGTVKWGWRHPLPHLLSCPGTTPSVPSAAAASMPAAWSRPHRARRIAGG